VKTLALLLSLLYAAGTALAADAPPLNPEERRVLETSPGVVFIQVWYTGILQIPGYQPKETSTMASSGTGFLYRSDGYIITNAHVVEDANLKDAIAQQLRTRRVYEVGLKWIQENLMHGQMTEAQAKQFLPYIGASTPHLEVYLNNHKMYTGEIKVYSDPSFINNGKDVAIVKIDGNNLPTVKLGNSDDVHVGEPLMVVGYPGVAMNPEMISKQSELVPSVTNGHVSAVKADYKGTPVLQSDVAVTHGNSGGPAFDPDGKAVGIATYVNEKEVQGFNFFVPINTALEFVRQAGAEPQSGEFDKTWESALDAYEQEDWATAHRLLGDVLNMMPNEPDAMRLENIAARNERNESPIDQLRHRTGPYLLPVVGVVVVIILALIIWRMASRKQPALATAGGPPIPASGININPSPGAPPPGAPQPHAPPQPPPGPQQTFGSLHVTAGSLNGNRFPIPKAGVWIGRDSSKCSIVIADDTVSKEHAWVVPVDHEVVVIDRGSSNGTYVNSTDSPRINKIALKNGDRIYIGKKGAAVLTYFSS
jgi:serine protease Do